MKIIKGIERDVLNEEVTVKMTNLEMLSIAILIGRTSHTSREEVYTACRNVSPETRDALLKLMGNTAKTDDVHKIYKDMIDHLTFEGVVE